ncbi:coiled-coil domain-containing protein 125-like isoform X2 [Dreissena polymorpha]|uniref:coiled-coil domain-containing protein 125-like isoform X2 n=1 Tax=Dreissena polymorpha TaxID=45954 RepID=UPI0022647B4C|nr:coiled-coil domain-containing protein 125-like isoform X2 [Dreissena polymorpha]
MIRFMCKMSEDDSYEGIIEADLGLGDGLKPGGLIDDSPKPLTSSEEIAMELAAKLQEVDDLKLELETCEQRLESKYQAIEILRKQAEEAQHRFKVRECSTREATMKLAQVSLAAGGGDTRVVSLGPDDLDLGDLTSSSIPRYHGSWNVSERKNKNVSYEVYKRMCQENMTLQDSLHLRTEQLRKVTSQKMAVERENDELLALLDIQERAKYELTRSSSTEEMYSSYSSTQLAVLGACRCRVSTPDPCGCALAAANLKKDIINMKQELCQYKTRRDEAYHTVDAYRQAFEEQLQKNKALTTQLANIGSGRSPTGTITAKSRAKLALHWLIGSLNDEELTEEEGPGCNMTEYELITYLTDMLNEKKEVLAHQKLATQILADRVKTLESQLAVFEKDGSKVVL